MSTCSSVAMRIALGAAIVIMLPFHAPAAPTAGAEPETGWVVELRHRHAAVDDAAFEREAQADTLRLRLGYRWLFAPDWQIHVDGEHVQPLFDEHYNSTANGEIAYPVVADPESTEINQAFIGYAGDALAATLGRQRLQIDNQRFIGNSGWRQNEQTFDAFSLRYAFEGAGPTLRYIWLDRVLRVNGHDNPDPLLREWGLDGHLLNLVQPLPLGSLTGYAYLVENHDIQAVSTRTFGLRWSGERAVDDVHLGWTLEYARQSDWAGNPQSLHARYRLIEPRASWRGITFKAGQELLGGDGRYGFGTPYATLHAFNGWADRFGITPVDGLDDRYVGAEGKLGKAAWVVQWHGFRADRGGREYGDEFDASLGYPLCEGLTGLLKFADYRSDGFGTDVRKLWLSLEYRY